jgi:membrane protein implicated in regulation of membrane protease activity
LISAKPVEKKKKLKMSNAHHPHFKIAVIHAIFVLILNIIAQIFESCAAGDDVLATWVGRPATRLLNSRLGVIINVLSIIAHVIHYLFVPVVKPKSREPEENGGREGKPDSRRRHRNRENPK